MTRSKAHGKIAGELLSRVAAAMDGLLDNWRSYKHAAALLDFDDLLYTARNLLAGQRTGPPGAGAPIPACSRRRVSGHRSAADRHSLAALRRGSKGRRRRSSRSGASSRSAVSGRRSQTGDLSFPRRRRERLYRRTHGHRRCRSIEDHRELPLGRADPQLRQRQVRNRPVDRCGTARLHRVVADL